MKFSLPVRLPLVAHAASAALALLLGACATSAPPPPDAADGGALTRPLACPLPSNCVNTLGTGGFEPLRFSGTPVQAQAALQAVLATFPEARVVKRDPLVLEVIFTTTLGFRDQVDFRIDAAAGRIDFRSRSLFGLFDFGKKRSRMAEFSARFARQPAS